MFKTLCMHCIRSTCISFSLAYIFSICENTNNLQVDMETQSLAFFALRKILEEKLWCLFYGILNKCNYVLNTFCFWSVPYSLLKLVNCLLFLHGLIISLHLLSFIQVLWIWFHDALCLGACNFFARFFVIHIRCRNNAFVTVNPIQDGVGVCG